MLTKLSVASKQTIAGNWGLRRYLVSLTKRVDFTPRSWLYDGQNGNPFLTPDAIRDKWLRILTSRLEHEEQRLDWVFDFDISQLSKWGPQGGHAPIKRLMSSVVQPSFELSGSQPIAYTDPVWERAKKLTVELLHRHGVQSLRPRSYKHCVESMRENDTLESNSGMPDFTTRALPKVKERALQDAQSGAWKSYPAIALFRTYNGKTRLVWMFPMSCNLVEASFFQPLQAAIMRSELSTQFFAPWRGFEQVRERVTSAYADGQQIAASDFTSTDAHFQWPSTEQVYDVIKQCFQSQFWERLRESLFHMHHIPLVVGPASQLEGSHGVASGSNWTNFVETVFDIVLGYYVKLKTKTVGLLYAIGDDMSWIARRFGETFREQLERIGNSVGQIIRADKTMVEADKVKTLQRLFIRGYKRPNSQLLRGIYSTLRALKSSVYPERWHKSQDWSADMFCARQFMILENCVDHPLFSDFVEFICKGNRHLIPFAKKTAEELDRITRQAKLVPGLNPTYNEEKKDSSLAAFASIRIAATL